jgi:hypothetical protein
MRRSLEGLPAVGTIQLSVQPVDDAILVEFVSAVESRDDIGWCELVEADRALLLVEGLPIGGLVLFGQLL